MSDRNGAILKVGDPVILHGYADDVLGAGGTLATVTRVLAGGRYSVALMEQEVDGAQLELVRDSN